MSGLSSGYNLPPGVYDNDPHFSGDEPEYDLEELKQHMEALEKAKDDVMDACDFIDGVLPKRVSKEIIRQIDAVIEEFALIKREMEDQGW